MSNFLEEISSLSQFIVFLYFLYWSLRKAFLPLLAILWNSTFKWVCISFSPLPSPHILTKSKCKYRERQKACIREQNTLRASWSCWKASTFECRWMDFPSFQACACEFVQDDLCSVIGDMPTQHQVSKNEHSFGSVKWEAASCIHSFTSEESNKIHREVFQASSQGAWV